ncbi:MAG: hypothetical protein DMG53_01255 [Acidobacteria bacterium]|nr:MAG: hypothetical protein DMG53_01255 [Acidobacteriota bacterium]
MRKRTWIIGLSAVVIVLGAAVAFFGYRKWGLAHGAAREEALALLPTDASAVVFADFDELRQAPFMAKLYAWAPQPPVDADYAQFVKETGFNYARDLQRITMAVGKGGPGSSLFSILDGKFDRQKISAYALKTGSSVRTDGREIFSLPVSGTARKICLTFLRNDRIAVTDDQHLALLSDAKKRAEDAADWRARFERLAGSPVFAVIRQDAAIGTALAAQAPSGLRSPQLSTLLDQLQWITLAGKPENDRLRVVAEGESTVEATARQLVDLLNGVVILAQLGLNDAQTRQQLDPAARQAYLQLLRSAEVSKIDRGDSQSVRVVFEITPEFLETAHRAAPVMPDSTPNKPRAGKARKGRT